MAQNFPSVDFFGIDIIPVPAAVQSRGAGGGAGLLRMSYDSDDEAPELPNVRFERSDVTMGLNHGDCEFDVVHCRNVLTVAVSNNISVRKHWKSTYKIHLPDSGLHRRNSRIHSSPSPIRPSLAGRDYRPIHSLRWNHPQSRYSSRRIYLRGPKRPSSGRNGSRHPPYSRKRRAERFLQRGGDPRHCDSTGRVADRFVV